MMWWFVEIVRLKILLGVSKIVHLDINNGNTIIFLIKLNIFNSKLFKKIHSFECGACTSSYL